MQCADYRFSNPACGSGDERHPAIKRCCHARFLSSAAILKDNSCNMQPSPMSGLPPPDETSRDHSQRCAEYLRARIRDAGGSLSFFEFMQEVLYAPGLGYYVAGATKFGRAGDFVTAPEISPLFGQVIARVCAEVLDGLRGGGVLEFGAGSGRLAVDILRRLSSLGRLPDRYSILEVSPDLRERQSRLIRNEIPELADRVCWLEQWPHGHRGVVVANEVLDALPVEIFRIDHGEPDRVRQLRVRQSEQGLAWTDAPAPAELSAAVAAIEATIGRTFDQGFVSEFAPLLVPWVKSMCACLERGVALLFDYGASRREYYAPGRSRGWLRCHFRHRAHDDPLILPGIQDLSCWVDFSAAASAAVDAGTRIAFYLPQSRFLLAGGLLDEIAAQAATTERERVELATQAKTLTLPGEMGERFKCLGLARDFELLPSSLSILDRTHTL
jgi:SAM-dependent MidA family methyltransferase